LFPSFLLAFLDRAIGWPCVLRRFIVSAVFFPLRLLLSFRFASPFSLVRLLALPLLLFFAIRVPRFTFNSANTARFDPAHHLPLLCSPAVSNCAFAWLLSAWW